MRHRAILAFSAALVAGCTPLHGWDAHTTSMPRPPAFDVGELARQPVATFGVLAPAGLQGFGPSLSQALATALAEAAPSVRGIPARATVNALNEQGLAGEYAELIAGFLRNGILERKRLQRIGPSRALRAASRARRVRSGHDRPARDLRLEGRPEQSDHAPAVAAALGRTDGPAALGVGRRGHRGERDPTARADRSSRRDRGETVAPHDPGRFAREEVPMNVHVTNYLVHFSNVLMLVSYS